MEKKTLALSERLNLIATFKPVDGIKSVPVAEFDTVKKYGNKELKVEGVIGTKTKFFISRASSEQDIAGTDNFRKKILTLFVVRPDGQHARPVYVDFNVKKFKELFDELVEYEQANVTVTEDGEVIPVRDREAYQLYYKALAFLTVSADIASNHPHYAQANETREIEAVYDFRNSTAHEGHRILTVNSQSIVVIALKETTYTEVPDDFEIDLFADLFGS